MLTFEKVLEVFQAYLDDDPLYEAVSYTHLDVYKRQGLCSMVNVSKSLLNVVSGNQAKVADKPEPKGVQSDVPL